MFYNKKYYYSRVLLRNKNIIKNILKTKTPNPTQMLVLKLTLFLDWPN